MALRPSALTILAGAIAAALLPPSSLTPSQWAAKNLIVVEGPRAGQLWDPTQTPYIAPIIDAVFCGPHPVGTVRKSAQTGFTQGLLAVEGWISTQAPARTLHVLPTTALAQGYNREKLQPSIDASPAWKSAVFAISKRQLLGSSSLNKVFAGGSIVITGANSAPELQMRTIKNALCDEIDQWPRDLAGQGSPMRMVDDRQIAFHASRDYRKLQGGTPTTKGDSLVDAEFEAGDQRYLRLPCPHCGDRIRIEFGGYADDPAGTGLRFNRARPYDAHVVAPCCGVRIEHWQKGAMIDACASLPDGGFVAEKPEPGRAPSWHIDALTSKLTTWDKIAETFVAAGDNPENLKGFWNRWLGLPYEESGDSPDWEYLYKRREAYAERVIPPDALLVTMGVDVQKRGLYVEIVGWTPDRRAYTLFASWLQAGTVEKPGDTSDSDDNCWRRLSELVETPLADTFGGVRRIDATGIDCRYNAPVVYDFCRRHAGVYALRTQEGWGLVALGNPQMVDFDWRGKRIRKGAMQWKVGSYNLKSRFYAYLAREAEIEDGLVVNPRGYCHFGSFLQEGYFKQLTAEYIGKNERGERIWKQRQEDNHFLDCRVLNMALAFGAPLFDIENRSQDFWERLAVERGVTSDLIAPLAASAAQRGAPPLADPRENTAPAPAPTTDVDGPDFTYRGGDWV